ncbi:acyltransferase [Pedobacter sp. MC2016-14]|uniref:acyltransferase family protein n=1 Tax=Pedobacter sp. MC2016-14 TaxID=2897327 RepID=UPI001E60FF7D|nr:acyltransferase [Pedobacter sp. MC2016-14]MCD0486850.1 acyltransferase [Pedobacter sp. MC2016-14]
MFKQSKITSLALLRGIAVVAVCLCHFGDQVTSGSTLPQLFEVFRDYGRYGVHIFFVISGFIIPYSLFKSRYVISDYFKFLYKRLLRLHPPYLVALLLTFIIAAVSYKIRHISNPETPLRIIKSLFYIYIPSENPVFWTLRIEAEYYLFIGLFFVALSKFPKLSMVLIIPFLMILTQTSLTNYIGLFDYLVFFLIGTLGYLIYIAEKRPYLEIVTLASMVIFSFCYYELPASISAVATVLVVLFYRRPVNSRLEFTGEISYSLYLMHFPIGIKLINLLQRYTNPSHYWMLLILAMLVCYGFSWGFWYFIEKPSARLSGGVKYGKPNLDLGR